MPLAEIGNVFWMGEPTRAEPKLTAHRIIRIAPGYTPADSECEEYIAACGMEGQSWSSSAMGVPQTIIAQNGESIPQDVQLCPECFPSKG